MRITKAAHKLRMTERRAEQWQRQAAVDHSPYVTAKSPKTAADRDRLQKAEDRRKWRRSKVLLVRGMLAMLVAVLTGCTTATIESADGSRISFTRSWTSAAVDVVESPDGGFQLHYSSDPQAQAMGQLAGAMTRLLAVVGPVAAVDYRHPAQLQASEAHL